jgi:hypothetical protein
VDHQAVADTAPVSDKDPEGVPGLGGTRWTTTPWPTPTATARPSREAVALAELVNEMDGQAVPERLAPCGRGSCRCRARTLSAAGAEPAVGGGG